MEKKLYRINQGDSVLGGVCLGLSDYFKIDVSIIRVVFVVLFFTPFPSFISYALLWIILPVAWEYSPSFSSNVESQKVSIMNNSSRGGNVVFGIILIVLGTIFAFKSFFDINLFHYIGKSWPLFLVGLGIWLIIRDNTEKVGGDNFNNPAS